MSENTSTQVSASQSSSSFEEVAVIARQAFLGNYTVMFQPEDATLFTRGNGRGLRLYDEIDNDPKVWETLQKRKLALVSREWQVEPASNSRIDKKAADLVKAQLENVGFDQLTSDMLDATMKGVSFIEPILARDGAEIVLTDAVHVEPWYFSFDRNPKPDDLVYARHAVRLLNGTGIEGITIPQRKMMVHRYGQKYNSPWGLGLGSRLFWPAFFKRNGIQFWLAFAERFGTPVPIGKYPNNATPAEKSTLKNALRAFQQESAIMVPTGMEVSLLEAARSGIDTYDKLVCYMDEQIAGIVLGKSGGKSGSGGQLAASLNLENEVRLELVKGDADLLTDTLTRQLVKWIVEFNCPGAATPRVERVIEETKNLKELAETHKVICDMGYRPTLKQIQDTFGGEWVDTGIASIKSISGTKVDDPTLNFAAPIEPQVPADQQAMDQLIATLPADLVGNAVGQLIAPVFAALKKSKDTQAALDSLGSLWPDMPMDDLQALLAKMIFTADLWGYVNADAEVKDEIARG